MTISRFTACSLGIVLVGATLLGQQRGAGSAAPGRQSQPASAAASRGNVDHGRYIVENVVMCFQCHSTRDDRGNIVPGTKFLGGPMPIRPPWPADWPTVIPRIAGLPGYTDEQAVRLLTQGAIKRDGTQLRPPMPPFHMTPQDAADVIAYLRTL